jgi:uncharacterized Zn-binding protein involved in type VI secretion
MLRLVLCIGDEPETGGHIDPFFTAAPSTIMGRPVAFIGGKAFCNACRNFGLIVKTGGPHRNSNCGREIALDGDALACQCSVPPRLIAKVQSIARHEDHGGVSNVDVQGSRIDLASSNGEASFDEQIRAASATVSLEGYPYFMETSDGRTFHGHINANGTLPRVTTGSTSGDYAIYWGDEALEKLQAI